MVYINCDNEPLMQTFFLADYGISCMLIGLQALSGQSIVPGKTLIIFDEIQEAPRGLHALKYFYENAPEYHVIAAGSLLGITLARQESFPVGKVGMLTIYPMDFEEFLMAMSRGEFCTMLRTGDYAMADTSRCERGGRTASGGVGRGGEREPGGVINNF